MKTILFFCSMIFAVSTSFAADTADHSTSHTAPTKAQHRDQEILGFLVVLNNNEIAAANLVAKVSNNDDVRAYATLMQTEHTKNLEDTLSLSKTIQLFPYESEKVIALKANGKKGLVKLMTLKGNAFDKAYIDAMVKGHTDALVAFDTMLLKNVSNPKLKDQLVATRVHVAHHLEQAKEIQKKLQAN